MDEYLRLLAGRQKSTVSEVVRQAIRDHLDVQEQLMGSRSRLGNRVARQLEEIQNRLVKQLNHMSALLLAAVILQQIQRGEPGDRVMERIVQLAGQVEEHLPGGQP
jgi:predicted DNA-binding protein